MSADSERDGRGIVELREMSEEEARNELTVVEYERWEKLHELEEGAEETREEWEREDEVVSDVVVHADKEALGTEVELYGDTVLVHVNSESRGLQQTVKKIEAFEEDLTDPDEFGEAEAERVTELLIEFFDEILVRYNDTEWASLSAAERESVLHRARSAWGLDAFILAYIDVMEAIHEDREERVGAVESFLGS